MIIISDKNKIREKLTAYFQAFSNTVDLTLQVSIVKRAFVLALKRQSIYRATTVEYDLNFR